MATQHASSQDLSEFFEELSSLVTEVETRDPSDADTSEILKEHIDNGIIFLTQLLYTDLAGNNNVAGQQSVNELLTNLRSISLELHRGLLNIRGSSRIAVLTLENPEKEQESGPTGPGRPRYRIDEERLLYLRELGFNWKTIAAQIKSNEIKFILS